MEQPPELKPSTLQDEIADAQSFIDVGDIDSAIDILSNAENYLGYDTNIYMSLSFAFAELGDMKKSKEFIFKAYKHGADPEGLLSTVCMYYSTHPTIEADDIVDTIEEFITKHAVDSRTYLAKEKIYFITQHDIQQLT